MAVEKRRGCGYRKIGGLYMVSGGEGMPCDRLPIQLEVCPVCGHGFKQTRGWTWIDVNGLVQGVHRDCKDSFPCPLCMAKIGKAGLLWIGEKFYKTPLDFDREAAEMGVSRRIKAVPRGFKVGETWVLLAHPKAISQPCANCEQSGVALETRERCETCDGKGYRYTAGIFKLWKPSRIEKCLAESQRGSEEHRKLEEVGITCVFFPDNDPNHRGTVYDKDDEEAVESDLADRSVPSDPLFGERMDSADLGEN